MKVAIAMVLFRGPFHLDLEAIADQAAASYPASVEVQDKNMKGDALSFRLDNYDVAIGKVAAPIPWSALEGPCLTSRLWREAEVEVKSHSGHAIVTVSGDSTPLDLAAALTRVTSAVLSCSVESIGVYWGNATLLIPKDLFVDFSTEVLPTETPVQIWIDFRVAPNAKGGSQGFTSGLAFFGHSEIEAPDAVEEPSLLYDRLTSLAGYLLENGPVIEDGHTVGTSKEEQIRIAVTKSCFGHKSDVFTLVYGEPHPKSKADCPTGV